MIRLLLIEYQPSLCRGLRLLLSAAGDIRVVGDTADCHLALQLVRSLRPDVVLADIDAPDMDLYTAACFLHEVRKVSGVIMLSLSDDPARRRLAEQVGAGALVVKSMPAEFLLTAIRSAGDANRIR